MEDRFIEIKFYYYMNRLIDKFNNDGATIKAFIDGIADAAGVPSSTILRVLKDVRLNMHGLRINKEEVMYLGRALGYSYRDINALTGIGVSTQSRLFSKNKENPYEFNYHRLPDSDFEAVKKFVNILDTIKEITL